MKQEHIDELKARIDDVECMLAGVKSAEENLENAFAKHSVSCKHRDCTGDCEHPYYINNGWCSDCSSDDCPLINPELEEE